MDFPFIYRKTGNLDGIQTKYIGSSFVAIKNNEEMQSFKDINKLLELQNIQFSMDEIKNLKSTYFDNIFNKLDDKKFTKTNENGMVGYKVTISGDEFKNVATQIIEALENDEDTKNKINELLAVIKGSSSKIDSTTIQGMKDQINNWELSNNVEIVVYEKDGNADAVKSDSFDQHVNRMAAAYDKMKNSIEEKYAKEDHKTEYHHFSMTR